MATCKVCRKDIPVGQGVLYQARGRALFVVCAEPCNAQVKNGFHTAGRVALTGLRTVLEAKAPGIVSALRTAHRLFSIGSGGGVNDGH